MLTGSHHLQVYWTSDLNGNMQHPFPYGWLIADKKWVPVQDTFLHDPNLPWWCQVEHIASNATRCRRPGRQPQPTFNPEIAELGIHAKPATVRPRNTLPITRIQLIAIQHTSPTSRFMRSSILVKRLLTTIVGASCGQCHSYQYTPDKSIGSKMDPVFCPGNT
ncbi:MAG: hypothetical protein Ct9H300mP7_3090 [Verrucomicrobiota bacterium]|nr:MAG: hypothetical protein Ct9H300mP7_3090 [Verrucomicrobiota bacterium]